MAKPVLVIVTGFPASGKTTLAKKIGEKFNLPVIYKDSIKESLFDSLGWDNGELTAKFGQAGLGLMWLLLEEMMSKQVSLIVEANFDTVKHSQKLEELRTKHGFAVVQVICITEVETLLARYSQRSKSADRHPGYTDDIYVVKYEKELMENNKYRPLEVTGETVEVDTTDFDKADFGKVFEVIEEKIG